MKWTQGEVRKLFLDFFEEKGHKVIPSSSLLPRGDPTLLFTNAGMNQFKPYFLGELAPPFKRAVSIQKCIRAGGKHNDLDNVGYTARHHTFFEMLGNFSFGDYFKKEAIRWAWELVTEVYGIPKERLWVSVYRDDETAYKIWKDDIGIPENRILRLTEKDNFWEMGDIGPCGPSSEIHYDMGEEHDPRQKDPSTEGERFIELWNLVFMESNRREDGTLESLPNKNIDTGMGFERLLAILQGVDTNFHTDLFLPLIEETERITGVKYTKEKSASHRVLSDHIRALTFAIADGIYPSNIGRGYVLRRILRRAHIFAQKIGVREPILYRLVPVVAEIMKDSYPEIMSKKTEIAKVIKVEEERFISNISSNIPRLEEALEDSKDRGILDGKSIFTLYDTYGIPIDLIEDYARDRAVRLDLEGFNEYMRLQRERAKRGREFVFAQNPWTVSDSEYKESIFVGYETLVKETTVAKYRTREDGRIEIVLRETPFYPEAGGQIGDKGEIISKDFEIAVEDTQRLNQDIVHIGRIRKGTVGKSVVTAVVDEKLRKATQRAHTATHLLQSALRRVLGEHIRQEGSLVEPDRLRFDFLHFSAVTEEEIRVIDRTVNENIRKNIQLQILWKNYREAIEEGAIAVFEEKYGEKVRVIVIDDISRELCGGTHIERTGDIGLFKIIKEESLSAGIRRIEALTGDKLEDYLDERERIIHRLKELMKTSETEVPDRVEKTLSELEELRREHSTLLNFYIDSLSKEAIACIEKYDDTSVVIFSTRDIDIDGLRRISDRIEESLKGQFIIVIGGKKAGTALLFIKVSPQVSSLVNAKELISFAVPVIKGGGGGNRTRAEGGGRDIKRLPEALKLIKEEVKKKLCPDG